MDHRTHMHLSEAELTGAALIGVPIYGPGGDNIATVAAVLGEGLAAHVIIDLGELLGIASKTVVVPVTELSFMRDHEGNVRGHTSWTEDQLNALPGHLDVEESR